MRPPLPLLAFCTFTLSTAACTGGAEPRDRSLRPLATSAADPAPAPAPPPEPLLLHREGQALVRSRSEPALYLADEDHSVLRRIPLGPALTSPPPLAPPGGGVAPATEPAFVDAGEVSVDLPGKPAQLLALGDRVLCTIRDPGMLLVLSAGEHPEEIGRVALPADAWGLAVTADGSVAYVTSAWTHQLSRVNLAEMTVTWSVDVAREPRGVTVTADGARVYVSHLIGADLTRVDVTGDASKPIVRRVALPADPLRTLAGDVTVEASLGYAALLSPDGRRLYTARHALGALWSWQGNVTVDVLATATDEPVAIARAGKPYGQLGTSELASNPFWADHAGVIAEGTEGFVQPRAMICRDKTRHLLVASEGEARLAELDALSSAPGLIVNRFYRLGGLTPEDPTTLQIPPHCGAPTGIALSADEDVAWVYCRSTDNVVAVRLTPDGERPLSNEVSFLARAQEHVRLSPWGPFAYARLAVPEVPADLALGRRLFYDAEEPVVSGKMGCAGCHPEGRDDGHVWQEIQEQYGKAHHYFAGPSLLRQDTVEVGNKQVARQGGRAADTDARREGRRRRAVRLACGERHAGGSHPRWLRAPPHVLAPHRRRNAAPARRPARRLPPAGAGGAPARGARAHGHGATGKDRVRVGADEVYAVLLALPSNRVNLDGPSAG